MRDLEERKKWKVEGRKMRERQRRSERQNEVDKKSLKT